jgi:hypothetical protein
LINSSARAFQRHLNHAHRAFHNFLTRGNNGRRLLALQHGRGDFRSVRQVADAGFHHFHAGDFQTRVNLGLQVLGHLGGVP